MESTSAWDPTAEQPSVTTPNFVMDTSSRLGQSVQESRGSFKLSKRSRSTSVEWDLDSPHAIQHLYPPQIYPTMPINFLTGNFSSFFFFCRFIFRNNQNEWKCNLDIILFADQSTGLSPKMLHMDPFWVMKLNFIFHTVAK